MGILGLGDRLVDELRDNLSRLENQKPIVIIAGIEEQERVRCNNGPWSATLIFNEPKEDGILGTMVISNVHFASVSVELTRSIGQPLVLAHYSYSDGLEHFDSRHVKKSRVTVQYIRDYVRRLALPELEQAHSEYEKEQQLKSSELDLMKKKYLK